MCYSSVNAFLAVAKCDTLTHRGWLLLLGAVWVSSMQQWMPTALGRRAQGKKKVYRSETGRRWDSENGGLGPRRRKV